MSGVEETKKASKSALMQTGHHIQVAIMEKMLEWSVKLAFVL
jgi:hypothetical protein